VQAHHPSNRLMRDEQPLRSETSQAQRRLMRRHGTDDVSAAVREAVDRDGYAMFRIRLSLSEMPTA
jgi:hypothetical protein